MKRTLLLLTALALVTLFATGCAGTAPVVQEPTPLKLSYDIEYVDDTQVGVDLMILSSDLSRERNRFARDMDAVMTQVGSTVPKSAILRHQRDFREVLSSAFSTTSEAASRAHLVVLQVYETRRGAGEVALR